MREESGSLPEIAAVRPLGALQTFETTDIDEQASLLRGWNQTYNQLSCGPFSGSLAEARLHGALLFREVTSNSLHQTGEPGDGVCALGVPLRLEGTATFCGRTCDGSQLHVFSGDAGFEFHSPSGLDIAGIVVPLDILKSHCSGPEREGLHSIAKKPHLRACAPDSVRRLRILLECAFEALGSNPQIAASPAPLVRLSQDIQTALLDALVGEEPSDAGTLSEPKRWQIVRSAREIAAGCEDGAVTIEDISSALGVSRRTMQYCFQESLGMRPATYLRALRLNDARRTIKNGGSVTDAATTWGFWHFGRFAHDYKALFGELPSATAQKFHARAN